MISALPTSMISPDGPAGAPDTGRKTGGRLGSLMGRWPLGGSVLIGAEGRAEAD